jgi:hypothetical protein
MSKIDDYALLADCHGAARWRATVRSARLGDRASARGTALRPSRAGRCLHRRALGNFALVLTHLSHIHAALETAD